MMDINPDLPEWFISILIKRPIRLQINLLLIQTKIITKYKNEQELYLKTKN